jgi:hypothetical protein
MTGDILAFRFQNLHECYLLFVWSSKSKPPRATEWVTWPAKRSRFLVAILWFDPCGAILSSRPQTLCAARVERRSRTRISRAREGHVLDGGEHLVVVLPQDAPSTAPAHAFATMLRATAARQVDQGRR